MASSHIFSIRLDYTLSRTVVEFPKLQERIRDLTFARYVCGTHGNMTHGNATHVSATHSNLKAAPCEYKSFIRWSSPRERPKRTGSFPRQHSQQRLRRRLGQVLQSLERESVSIAVS